LNFKIIALLPFLILSFSRCGVKSDPVPPQDTLLPSVESQYLKQPMEMTHQKNESSEKKPEEELEKESEEN
tara:strand:- start:8994 stop:9206 length:213 start_codon:yes stop_codon:yes gene_type:complete